MQIHLIQSMQNKVKRFINFMKSILPTIKMQSSIKMAKNQISFLVKLHEKAGT